MHYLDCSYSFQRNLQLFLLLVKVYLQYHKYVKNVYGQKVFLRGAAIGELSWKTYWSGGIEYRVDQSTYSKEKKEKNFSPSQLAQAQKEKEIVNKIIQENVSDDFTTGLRWLSYFFKDSNSK